MAGKETGAAREGKKVIKPKLVDQHGHQPLIRRGDAPGASWKKRSLDKMEPGDVLGIPVKVFPKFREPFEETAGGELKSLRCYHTQKGEYVRIMMLPKGPGCLDCMVVSVNAIYPR